MATERFKTVDYIAEIVDSLSKVEDKGGKYVNTILAIVTCLSEIEGGMFRSAKMVREFRFDELKVTVDYHPQNLTILKSEDVFLNTKVILQQLVDEAQELNMGYDNNKKGTDE